MLKTIYIICCLILLTHTLKSQQSVARRWNEVQLSAIRQDLARPPVQARNLFHVAIAMYDAWAVYHSGASTYLLGKTINGVYYPYTGTLPLIGNDTVASQRMAISYAANRLLRNRYAGSPNAFFANQRFDTLMSNLGYSTAVTSTNYLTGTPADLGNYIADQVIAMGMADGARQAESYSNSYYAPVNPYLFTANPGSSNMINPNSWQPLNIVTAFDQNGNPISSNQTAVCHEWGNVYPFSLDANNPIEKIRNGKTYKLYFEPAQLPPLLDTTNLNDAASMQFKWAHAMVAVWSSLLDPRDTTMIDISPKSIGNLTDYPATFNEEYNYYNYFHGGDTSHGHPVNPSTNLPYAAQLVRRGDYARVISQYWADGPNSETPPGHWFVILNNVSDHPLFVKKFKGQGAVLSGLEWDIKSYFTLGGAIHDAAIAAWGLKGWYDSPRPISAIRKMAEYGQSSDSTLPHFHKGGLPLIPGYIELVMPGDSLVTVNAGNLYKIKLKAWRGFSFIANSFSDFAGVGWILAENWMPYQRSTFVTPPFAGFASGHSTYSRAGAETMAAITGSPYFPGGIYENTINANSNFLAFEKGPSAQIKLQWATYTDASNEASISRIYGGIHPPLDDAFGRDMGKKIAAASVTKANQLFYPSLLPVHLVYFKAVEKNCLANLYWATDTKTTSTKFEIWRSIDGINFGNKVSEIVANSSSDNLVAYNSTDKKPVQTAFYRLVEIGIDGRKTILANNALSMAHCFGTDESTVAVFPNPATDKLSIRFISKENNQMATVKIVDVLGKIVFTQKLHIVQDENTINVNIKKLIAGNYFARIVLDNGSTKNFRFIKIDK